MLIKIECLDINYDENISYISQTFNNQQDINIKFKCIDQMGFESYNPNKLILVPLDRHELSVYGGPSNKNMSS